MSKYKFDNYSDILAEESKLYDAKFSESEKAAEKNSLMLLNNTDGKVNGSHQLVETEAHKKWLTALQEKNPFIGKDYMQRAPEFERETEEVKKQEYMDDAQMSEALDEHADPNGAMHIKDDYNPNVKEDDVEDHDAMSRRFVEACIIDNTAAKCIGWDFKDVLEECADALLEEFGDLDNFELPGDFDKLVEASVEKAEAEARLLNYDKKVKDKE